MKRAATIASLAAVLSAAAFFSLRDVHRAPIASLQPVDGAKNLPPTSPPEADDRANTDDGTLSPHSEPKAPAIQHSDAPATANGNDANRAPVDHSDALKWARENATRLVRRNYAVLLERLELTTQQQDALLALLTQDLLGTAYTYDHGTIVRQGAKRSEEDRSKDIATIIGDLKLKEFLALERNLTAYSEASRIASLLEQNGVPTTSSQRDKLVTILAETRNQYIGAVTTKATDQEGRSLEYLEKELAKYSEYERHVVELAPAVLTPEQVVYLDKQYQYLSNQRANSLEQQRKQRADGTLPADSHWWFPTWN